MTTVTCELTTSTRLRSGDLVLLSYLNADQAAFTMDQVPSELHDLVQPASDPGGSRTVFAGKVGRSQITVRTVRLDAKHSSLTTEMKKCVSAAIASCDANGFSRIMVMLGIQQAALIRAAHEGAVLGGYRFRKYLSASKPIPDVTIATTKGKTLADIRAELRTRSTLYECVNFARDVLNEPPNVLKPPQLAQRFRSHARNSGLRVTVWDHTRLQKERCGGIVAVGQGAAAKPCLVIGTYTPTQKRSVPHLCLVGKGVTYDSGGYGLKPASSQVGMKYDMGGAAMMFAAATAIARLKLPIKVTVLTPLAENDISAQAYHTTSILTTRSGRTVEVHHTDAEGRLLLADALTIAGEKKCDWIIDAATLTGACVVALGDDIAGVYGTDDAFTDTLIEAGSDEGERFWQMPLHMPYGEQIKSTIADCKNVGGKMGGSITAAVFLKQWVSDDAKWIHCDIAGPGIKEEPLDHLGKAAKGFGVKTIVTLAQRLCEK